LFTKFRNCQVSSLFCGFRAWMCERFRFAAPNAVTIPSASRAPEQQQQTRERRVTQQHRRSSRRRRHALSDSTLHNRPTDRPAFGFRSAPRALLRKKQFGSGVVCAVCAEEQARSSPLPLPLVVSCLLRLGFLKLILNSLSESKPKSIYRRFLGRYLLSARVS
jgi:hypothetical protein